MAKDSANLAPTVFASLCIGCSVNPLHFSSEKKDILHMFKMVDPCAIFCDIEVYELVKDCLTQLGNNAQIFTFNGSKGDSEPVENLFFETGTEDYFL